MTKTRLNKNKHLINLLHNPSKKAMEKVQKIIKKDSTPIQPDHRRFLPASSARPEEGRLNKLALQQEAPLELMAEKNRVEQTEPPLALQSWSRNYTSFFTECRAQAEEEDAQLDLTLDGFVVIDTPRQAMPYGTLSLASLIKSLAKRNGYSPVNTLKDEELQTPYEVYQKADKRIAIFSLAKDTSEDLGLTGSNLDSLEMSLQYYQANTSPVDAILIPIAGIMRNHYRLLEIKMATKKAIYYDPKSTLVSAFSVTASAIAEAALVLMRRIEMEYINKHSLLLLSTQSDLVSFIYSPECKANEIGFYIETDKLQYVVKDPQGKIQTGEIARGRGEDQLEETDLDYIKQYCSGKQQSENIKNALRAFFNITSKRGHTHTEGRSFMSVAADAINQFSKSYFYIETIFKKIFPEFEIEVSGMGHQEFYNHIDCGVYIAEYVNLLLQGKSPKDLCQSSATLRLEHQELLSRTSIDYDYEPGMAAKFHIR